jgi:hypothetical protein
VVIHGLLCSPPFNDSALLNSRKAFEWIVRDVQKLRDFVERLDPTDDADTQQLEGVLNNGHGEFEVLKESPMLGDGKFKLEIGA